MAGNELTGILDKLQKEFHAAATMVYETMDPVVASTECEKLTTQLQLYATLRFIKDTIKELETMVNKNLPTVAERAEKIMTQEGMDSIELLGYKFSPDKENYISVTNANKPAVLEWLKHHELGREMVKLGYHPKTFDSFIEKEFIEKGEKPPSFISVFSKPILEVRKVRGG